MEPKICFESLVTLDLPLLETLLSPELEVKQTRVAPEKGITLPRDTSAKQWQETRIHAIEGTGRVMKSYLTQLQKMPEFTQAWDAYLNSVSLVLSNPAQVSLSAAMLNSFSSVVTSTSAVQLFTSKPEAWKRVVPLLISSLEAAAVNIQENHLDPNIWMESVTAIVNNIAVLTSQASLRQFVSEEEIKQILSVCSALLTLDCSGYSENAFSKARRDMARKMKRGSIAGLPSRETPLQAAVLRFLELYFTPQDGSVDKALYPVLFKQLMTYLSGNKPVALLGMYLKTAASFIVQVLPVVMKVLTVAVDEVVCEYLCIVVDGLTPLLHCAARNLDTLAPLCSVVIDTFTAVLDRGLLCLNQSEQAVDKLEGFWVRVLRVFSTFIFGHEYAVADSAVSTPKSVATSLFEHELDKAAVQGLPDEEQSMRLMEEEGFVVSEKLQLLFIKLQVRLIASIAKTLTSSDIEQTPLYFQHRLVQLLYLGAGMCANGDTSLPVPSPAYQPAREGKTSEVITRARFEQISTACFEGLFAIVHCPSERRSGAHKTDRSGAASVDFKQFTKGRERLESDHDDAPTPQIMAVANSSSSSSPRSPHSTPTSSRRLPPTSAEKQYSTTPRVHSSFRRLHDNKSTASHRHRLPEVQESCVFCNLSISAVALPLLVRQWEGVLQAYIHQKVTSTALTAILINVGQLETHASLATLTRANTPFMLLNTPTTPYRSVSSLPDSQTHSATAATTAAAAALGTGRGHLLKLFPLLCQCIVSEDPKLRTQVKQLFLLASQQLGLS
jgi:hypothetical protein